MPSIERGLHADELKELFYIDEDWNLRRRVAKGSKAPANTIAGSSHSGGYRKVMCEKRMFFVHRIIWALHYGEWPKNQLDHINGIKDDNRIENLREVTHTENAKNQKMRKNNKTGVIGLSWCDKRATWRVRISTEHKQISLGCYADFFEAACARKSAELQYGFHANHGRIQ